MVSPNLGIRTSTAIEVQGASAYGLSADFANCGLDTGGAGNRRLLQRGAKRNWHVQGRNAFYGRVEGIEALLGDDRRYISGSSSAQMTFVHDDRPVGLLNRAKNCLLIQRNQGSGIYDLHVDAIL